MWNFTPFYRYHALYCIIFAIFYGILAAERQNFNQRVKDSDQFIRSSHDAKSEKVMYPDRLNVLVSFSNDTRILRLRKNLDLLATGYKEVHFENGRKVVNKPFIASQDFCYYEGTVDDDKESHAAVNLCHGQISGTVYFSKIRFEVLSNSTSKLLYLTPAAELDDPSKSIYTCGHGSKNVHGNGGRRIKRAPQLPSYYKKYINWKELYVEMAIVFDNSVYRTAGGNKDRLFARAKELANYVNSFYQPVNIKVALVGVEVWTDKDKIAVTDSGDATLDQFLQYRRHSLLRNMPNDHAQLITTTSFTGGVVGKAMKGTMCALDLSGAVIMDHSQQASTVAATMAHEMGHNFGMDHDNDTCQCPQPRCIMAASSTSSSNMYWSTCSMEYLAWSISHGSDYCLKNKPSHLFEAKSPICGNGFVEDGEQCDCGLPEACDNPCCNASTCQLAQGAVCASGGCCDTSKCQYKPTAAVCREGKDECDLPEYCNGKSETCPNDTHKQNGVACGGDKSNCYNGLCGSHDGQCKLIWGPTGKSAGDECYALNSRGDMQGNCGKKPDGGSHVACSDGDVMCGALQCSQRTEKTQFGDRSLVRMAYTEIRYSDRTSVCNTVSIDLGSDENDPGLVPSGAKCGKDKMCKGRKCIPVSQVLSEKPCKTDCHGNGVCNNFGNCHCEVGYGGADCASAGLGGSIDSGPASTGENTSTRGPSTLSSPPSSPVTGKPSVGGAAVTVPVVTQQTTTEPDLLLNGSLGVPGDYDSEPDNGTLSFPGNRTNTTNHGICILFEECSSFNVGIGVLIFLVIVLPLASAFLTYLYKKGKINPPRVVKIFDKPKPSKHLHERPKPPSNVNSRTPVATTSTLTGTTVLKSTTATAKPTIQKNQLTSPEKTTPAFPAWPSSSPCAVTNESRSFPKPTVTVNLQDGLLPVIVAMAASNVSLPNTGTATNPSVTATSRSFRPKVPPPTARVQEINELEGSNGHSGDDIILPCRRAPPPPAADDSGVGNAAASNVRKLSAPEMKKLAVGKPVQAPKLIQEPKPMAVGKPVQAPKPIQDPKPILELKKAVESTQQRQPPLPSPGPSSKPLLPFLPPGKPKPTQSGNISPDAKKEVVPSYSAVEKKPKPPQLPLNKPAIVPDKAVLQKAAAISSGGRKSDEYYDVVHSKIDSPKNEEPSRQVALKPIAQSSKRPSKDESVSKEPTKAINGPVKSALVNDLEKRLKTSSNATSSPPVVPDGKKALVPPPVQRKTSGPSPGGQSAKNSQSEKSGHVSQIAARFEKQH